MVAKDRHRATLIAYLSDWANPFPSRVKMAEVCGINPEALRKHFTPDEYAEIENEGLELRKKNSTIPRGKIYDSLADAGADGDTKASNLFLERTEGKVTEKIQHSFLDAPMLSAILDNLPIDQQESTKQALLELSKKA